MIRLPTAVLLALAPVLSTQEPVPAPAPAPAPAAKPPAIRFDATTMVLPAGKLELRELVDATARFSKRNILCDDAELRSGNAQPVVLQNAITLDAGSFEEAVGQLLYSHGFVLLARDAQRGLYEVVSLTGARARDVMSSAPQVSVDAILAQPRLTRPVTTVVKLQTINATIAVNTLRPFFAVANGPGGLGLTFGSAGSNDALLLNGLQCQVADAIRVIRKADGQEEAGPEPAAAADLHSKIATLEQTVRELTARLAALEKRLTGAK